MNGRTDDADADGRQTGEEKQQRPAQVEKYHTGVGVCSRMDVYPSSQAGQEDDDE